MRQEWFCEACKTRSVVEADDHIDAMGMIYLIGDAHRALSPECPNGVCFIRVVNQNVELTEEEQRARYSCIWREPVVA